MSTTHCLNCHRPLGASDRYCANCGQDAHIHPISFSHFIHDATHFFTHADKGIFSLIRSLALRPGLVASEYLAGKRKKYMSPLNFFLIMIGLFVFALSTFHTFEQSTQYAQMRYAAEQTVDPVARERRIKKTDRAEQANKFMTKNSNLVSLLLATPLLTLILYLFYRRAGYNYMEHLAVNFYFGGFTSLFFIFIIAPLINLVNNQSFYLSAIVCFLLVEVLYRSFAYYQFIQKKGFPAYCKAFLVSFLGITLWATLSSTVMALYIAYGFYLF